MNLYLSLVMLTLVTRQSLGQAMCPIIEHKYSDSRLESADPHGPKFREISGLAFSPTQKYNGQPLFFAASDGGGDARIGIFDSETGNRLKTLRVDPSFFRNTDWEEMTIGSCGSTGVDDICLYVMDIGDNRARNSHGENGRSNYQILKIREPRLNEYNDNDMISKSQVSRMRFDYRDSSSPTNYADCEAVFLDHAGWGNDEMVGDIYLGTKWNRGNDRYKNRLFRFPASAWPSSMNGSTTSYSPKTVGSYNYDKYQSNGGSHYMQWTWTSGEMSLDGTLIGLGTTLRSYVFLRCPGTSVADALVNPDANSKACLDWSHPASGQVETYAWTPDKRYALEIPEGNAPKLGWTRLKYDRHESPRVCPTPAPTPAPTEALTEALTEAPTKARTEAPTEASTEPVSPAMSPSRPVEPPLVPSDAPSAGVSESPSSISPSSAIEATFAPFIHSTSCNGNEFKLVIHTDFAGSEVSWDLKDDDQQQVAAGSGYPNNEVIEIAKCVDAGSHTFTIWDSSGDGICCMHGQGWYQIWYDGVIIHDSDGNFGIREIMSFAESGIIESLAPTSEVSTTNPASNATFAPIMDGSTADSEEEMFCQGVCPSGSYLEDYSQTAQFTDGRYIPCGELDQQYMQLLNTDGVCDALATLAQDAGCRCSNPANVVTRKPFFESEELEDDVDSSRTTAFAFLAVLCIVFIGCFIRIVNQNGDNESTVPTADEPSVDEPCKAKNIDPTPHAQLNGESYKQSWVLWTASSDRDIQTDAETIDSESPMAV